MNASKDVPEELILMGSWVAMGSGTDPSIEARTAVELAGGTVAFVDGRLSRGTEVEEHAGGYTHGTGGELVSAVGLSCGWWPPSYSSQDKIAGRDKGCNDGHLASLP